MGKKELTKDQLLAAYHELGEMFEIQPPLNEKLTAVKFGEALYGVVTEIVEPEDEFSEETQAVFNELISMYGETEEAEEEEAEEEVEEEEAEEEAEEEVENDVVEQIEAATKKSVLLNIIDDNADLFGDFDPAEHKTVKGLQKAMLNILAPPAPVEEKPKAPAKEKGPSKPTTAERVEFVTKLINAGKGNKKEILEKMCTEFPANSRSAHSTILSDGKNPKYCSFEFVLAETEGVLSFTKQIPDKAKKAAPAKPAAKPVRKAK